jgi:hypothetical protein
VNLTAIVVVQLLLTRFVNLEKLKSNCGHAFIIKLIGRRENNE